MLRVLNIVTSFFVDLGLSLMDDAIIVFIPQQSSTAFYFLLAMFIMALLATGVVIYAFRLKRIASQKLLKQKQELKKQRDELSQLHKQQKQLNNLLEGQIKERTDELQRANYDLIAEIITSQRHREESNYLLAILETVDDIAVIKDLDLRIIATNQAMADATGFDSPQELIGKTDAEAYDIPENQEPVKGYMAREREAQKLKAGEYLLNEELCVYANGEEHVIYTKKFPIYDGNQVVATASVSRDITERKKQEAALQELNQELEKRVEDRTQALQKELSERQKAEQKIKEQNEAIRNQNQLIFSANEELYLLNEKLRNANRELYNSEARYRSIMESMTEGVYICTTDHRITYYNPAMQKLFSDKDIEKPCYQVVYGADKPCVWCKMPHILQGQSQRAEIFNPNNEKTYLVYSSPLRYVDGTVAKLSIYNDISDRKAKEEALTESEHQLRQLNATKDKFFSIIAHDLKNPFNSILGLSKFLATDSDKIGHERLREHHLAIYRASKQAYRLLANLLDWSRSQTGHLKSKPEVIDLFAAFDNVMTIHASMAEAKKLQMTLSPLDEQQHNKVMMDRNMLHTILRNLLSNAIKFTPVGGQVNIALEPHPQDKDMLIINVQDTGIGISPEDQERLFHIDKHISKRGTAEEQGTGLGLILVKEFVEHHGGRIWVDSEPNKGSTFRFSCPKA